ncbi:MAG: hypothetical protein HJJLKODD_01751 [Phycisphaerae bacterium]|nr:hypothetical protein [Phycisphaerae bacterium]
MAAAPKTFWVNLKLQMKYQRKKALILGGLLGTWLVLMVLHLGKGTPKQAPADTPSSGKTTSVVPPGGSVEDPDKTTAAPPVAKLVKWSQIHKDIKGNPFAALPELTGTGPATQPIDWTRNHPNDNTNGETSLTRELTGYDVSMLVRGGEHSVTPGDTWAMINGRVCYVGSRLDQYTIVEFQTGQVIVRDNRGQRYFIRINVEE